MRRVAVIAGVGQFGGGCGAAVAPGGGAAAGMGGGEGFVVVMWAGE